ncbi:hypothetical protein [Arthrobacter sp. NicSoilB4]|uniref:hypothetical protein n=1 Tax=Arthrobacter sp. NicSoilB4 TaxID=2830997 RepID=UPI001CC78364|nr:hypothetical protein [Arthrobacter sp. NicSoilB4]
MRTIVNSGTNSPNDTSGRSSASAGTTHRAGSARPVAVTVWLCAAVVMAWLLLAGRTEAAMAAAPWLFLASWFVYAAQWRPLLRTDAHGFELVNGLRDHRIPYEAVEDIEVRYTVAVRAAGRRYVSWGAPTPPGAFGSGFDHVSDLKSRPYSILPGNERISQKEQKTGRDAIVAAWQDASTAAAKRPAGAVVSSWHLPTVIVGGIAVAWAVLSAFG